MHLALREFRSRRVIDQHLFRTPPGTMSRLPRRRAAAGSCTWRRFLGSPTQAGVRERPLQPIEMASNLIEMASSLWRSSALSQGLQSILVNRNGLQNFWGSSAFSQGLQPNSDGLQPIAMSNIFRIESRALRARGSNSDGLQVQPNIGMASNLMMAPNLKEYQCIFAHQASPHVLVGCKACIYTSSRRRSSVLRPGSEWSGIAVFSFQLRQKGPSNWFLRSSMSRCGLSWTSQDKVEQRCC